MRPLPPPSDRPAAPGMAAAGDYTVTQAAGVMPVDPRSPAHFASPAVYDPNRDPTRNIQAANQQNAAANPGQQQPYAEPISAPPGQPIPAAANEPGTSPGYKLFHEGEAALAPTTATGPISVSGKPSTTSTSWIRPPPSG